jgi:hypothetical protein
MTRDEIRLMLFLLAALAVGAGVQWWARFDPAQPAAPVDAKKGWTNPPYVFKSRAEMDRVRDSLEKDHARP